MAWEYNIQFNCYAIEVSELSNFTCPKCGKEILKSHLISTDTDGEDVAGWNYRHPCGVNLLVIND